MRVEPAILAYKVFADGREELLRNVEIAGMNVTLFKDILAAGREPSVVTIPFRSRGVAERADRLLRGPVAALRGRDLEEAGGGHREAAGREASLLRQVGRLSTSGADLSSVTGVKAPY